MVYEDLLAESVSCHLQNELRKIATGKAKAICQPFLRTIGDHEQRLNNTTDEVNKFLEAWQEISKSYFYMTDLHERQEDSACASCPSVRVHTPDDDNVN